MHLCKAGCRVRVSARAGRHSRAVLAIQSKEGGWRRAVVTRGRVNPAGRPCPKPAHSRRGPGPAELWQESWFTRGLSPMRHLRQRRAPWPGPRGPAAMFDLCRVYEGQRPRSRDGPPRESPGQPAQVGFLPASQRGTGQGGRLLALPGTLPTFTCVLSVSQTVSSVSPRKPLNPTVVLGEPGTGRAPGGGRRGWYLPWSSAPLSPSMLPVLSGLGP